MDLRPYRSTDRDACLAVFDSNAPEYFAPGEREQFERFLDQPDSPYLVMEHEGSILGCGGYCVEDQQGLASLVWGLVRRDSHKLGLGRFLLMYRLREIGKSSGVRMVRLDTSQRAAPFFEKQGFRAINTVKDGYGPGLDRIEMVKKMTVCP